MNKVTITELVFILAAACVPQLIALHEHGITGVSDSNPVAVGGTATFTCNYEPRSDDVVDGIYWSAHQPAKELVLEPGEGTSCRYISTDPTLFRYTFRYTCDTVNNRFTLSIVGVTESDIKINNTWCCEIRHAHYWLDGTFCGKITEAANGAMVTKTPSTAASARTPRTGKDYSNGPSNKEPKPARTTMVRKPSGNTETVTPAAIAEVSKPSAKSCSERTSMHQCLLWSLIGVVSFWLWVCRSH